LQLEVYEKIELVANKIKEIEGIVGIVLFGSFSRGDYDDGSDIDLLVVFKDKKYLERGLREMYKITAKTNLFFQAIGLTLDELKNSKRIAFNLQGFYGGFELAAENYAKVFYKAYGLLFVRLQMYVATLLEDN